MKVRDKRLPQYRKLPILKIINLIKLREES